MQKNSAIVLYSLVRVYPLLFAYHNFEQSCALIYNFEHLLASLLELLQYERSHPYNFVLCIAPSFDCNSPIIIVRVLLFIPHLYLSISN